MVNQGFPKSRQSEGRISAPFGTVSALAVTLSRMFRISDSNSVLEKPDGSAVRLVSQSDFMDGMGMYYSGYIAKQHREKEGAAGVPMFLAQAALKPFVESNLDVLQFEPVDYITESGSVAKGIPAESISKICKVWADARRAGALGKAKRMLQIAEKAAIIRDVLADVAMVALVDEATGYQNVRASQKAPRGSNGPNYLFRTRRSGFFELFRGFTPEHGPTEKGKVLEALARGAAFQPWRVAKAETVFETSSKLRRSRIGRVGIAARILRGECRR